VSPSLARSRTFAALQSPQFRLLWFGNIFSFLGMQMQVLARGYLAYDLTGKNTALGTMMVAFGLPQLVLSLFGGVVADRLPKRRVLVVCQLIVAANSAWIATMLALGQLEFWMLVVAGFVQGSGFSFIGPARQAYIGELVPRQDLGNAVVLQQLSMNSTRVVGPSLAGAFIAISFIGAAGVYYMTTAGFLLAIVSLFWLPAGEPRAREVQTSPMRDLKDGLSYVRRQNHIGILILASFAIIMVGFPYQSFLASISKSVYGVGSGGFGVLSSVSAVGAVVATIAVASISTRRAVSWQRWAGLAFGAALIGLGLTGTFVAGLVAIVFVGGLSAAFQSLNNSLVMTYTEPIYQGRVQAMNMMSWSLFGLAALPIGIVADHIGIQETLILQGSICMAAIVLLDVLRRRTVTELAGGNTRAPELARERSTAKPRTG